MKSKSIKCLVRDLPTPLTLAEHRKLLSKSDQTQRKNYDVSQCRKVGLLKLKVLTINVSLEKWKYRVGRICNFCFSDAILRPFSYVEEAAAKLPCNFKPSILNKIPSLDLRKYGITQEYQTFFHVSLVYNTCNEAGISLCITQKQCCTSTICISYLLLKPCIENMNFWNTLSENDNWKRIVSCSYPSPSLKTLKEKISYDFFLVQKIWQFKYCFLFFFF